MQQNPQTPPAVKPAKPAPPKPPAEMEEGAIAKMDAAGLVRILGDASASEFQKSKACVRAGEIGAKQAIPALAALLGNERLSTYARYGLEPIDDPAVDDALRAAMPKLKGDLLIGVVNSLGKRRDSKALPALAKMMYGGDAAQARAAAAAIGSIGTVQSVKELEAGMGKTTGMTRMAVADAALVCAERLIAGGERDRGLKLYAFVSNADVPKPQRLAAMSGIVREETSLSRPR